MSYDVLVSLQSCPVYVGYFSGMPADYVFMLVFNAICIDVSLQPLKYGKMLQLNQL